MGMGSPGWDWLLISACLLFSSFFSGSETALTALSAVRLEQALQEKDRPSRLLRLWRDRPTQVLTTILIGNNAVNILAFLFLGGVTPAAPGPYFCGDDPTDDEIPPCDYTSCSS